jgi:hypothetical protein
LRIKKIDDTGEWLIVQIFLLRQQRWRPNGRKERESGLKKKIPSPPVPWGGAWFGAEVASGDF